jgi:hypothetical protein
MIGLNSLQAAPLLPDVATLILFGDPFALSPWRESFKMCHVILDTDIGTDVDDMLGFSLGDKTPLR